MENVSKVLLIAAAMLVTVMLITLGISILNSQKNINDEASVVGKLMDLKTDDTADIIEGYSVNRYDDEIVDVSQRYYIDYFTGIKLDEKAQYIISFDYIIQEKGSRSINCGIGFGIDNPKAYNRDFVYQVKYPNQNIGEKSTFTFTLIPNNYENFRNNKDANLYLSLRLARTEPASTFKVSIENIKIKYKSE